MTSATGKKTIKGKLESNEGILLSLLYLGRELEDANMAKSKERVDEALVTAIDEMASGELSSQEAANAAAFLKRAFSLNKEAMLDLIDRVNEIDQNYDQTADII